MNFSPDWIKKSLEISLKRLQLDYVDLFVMHGGEIKNCTHELISTFQKMKDDGSIRAYGINSFSTEVLEWVAKEKCFDYVMLDYNIMRKDRESLINKLTSAGVAVIAGAALGQSFYSRKMFRIKNRNDLWYLLRGIKNFPSQMKKSKQYRFLNSVDGYTANQLALRYVLDNKQISSAVFATTSIEHLEENLKATEIVMPEKVRNKMKTLKTETT